MSRSRKHWPRPRALELAQQLARMALLHPQLAGVIRGGTLVCRGVLRPHALTRLYRVRLEYKKSLSPKVWVEDPVLVPLEQAGRVEHVYGPDGEIRPCLYHPPSREWRDDMWLATSVIPWLMAWLIYYELWHATGRWSGGGVDHGDGDKPTQEEREP